MKKMKFFILLSLLIGGIAGSAGLYKSRLRQGKTVSRVFIRAPMRTPYDGRQLIGTLTKAGFDVAGFNWKQGTIEVITDEAGIAQLRSRNLEVVVSDRLFDPGSESIDPRYLTPLKVENGLRALNARFPQITRLEQIGTSLQGRPILALLVSSTPNAKDPAALAKPSLIFDGMHHAREIMTPEIVFDVAETLLAGAQMRAAAPLKAIQDWNIWVVPMLNVDGNNIVWTEDAWWRKNARAPGVANVFGVDINRNYPFRWNGCGGSSGSQSSETYRGQSAASEPETQALMRLGQMAQPTGSLSYHSYSELVLYPFGCEGELSGENALLEKVSKELAGILPRDSRDGFYTPGTPWQILYGVDGDSMSYMHSEFGTLAYTFEVNQDFQPSYSVREPTLQKHRKAWQYFIQRMSQNLLTIKVTDGRTGQPAVAQIDVSTIAHKYGERNFRTNPAGYFFKVFDPGHYVFRVTLADGRRVETAADMNAQPQNLMVVVP